MKPLFSANGRTVKRLALAGERLLVKHDSQLVALLTLDGERLWQGRTDGLMTEESFVVDAAGRRAVVYGDQSTRILELADGRVVAEDHGNMAAIRHVDFDGERVVSTAYQTPFDWGELDLWHVGGESRRIAGEIGRSSAVTFLDANELLVADGSALCRYDLAGTVSSEVRVGFWIDRLISLGADGVLAIGNELALVDPRTGAVRWAPPDTDKPQRFVVARDGRRLVRLPGLVHTHAPQIAEAFIVGNDASRTVSAPPDVDWGRGAWLDDDRVALSCACAVYCWDLRSGALALVADGGVDVTALAGAGARIVAGYADGSIVELSAS